MYDLLLPTLYLCIAVRYFWRKPNTCKQLWE